MNSIPIAIGKKFDGPSRSSRSIDPGAPKKRSIIGSKVPKKIDKPPIITTKKSKLPPKSDIPSSSSLSSSSSSSSTMWSPSINSPSPDPSPPLPVPSKFVASPLMHSRVYQGTPPQSPLLAHQIDRFPVSALPFKILPRDAQSLFENWLNSLWFCPAEYLSQARAASMSILYLPYYLFSVRVASIHSGSIAFTQLDHPTDPNVLDSDFDWQLKETPPSMEIYSRIEVYAPDLTIDGANAVGNQVPRFDELEGEVDNWNMEPQFCIPFNPSDFKEGSTITPISVEEAWDNFGINKVGRLERSSQDIKFKRSFPTALRVKDVVTTTQVVCKEVAALYVPLFGWRFDFEGSTYRFLANGQTGYFYGQRPFGLPGNLRNSAIRLLTGNISSSEPVIVEGRALGSMDNSDAYDDGAHYLTFSPSDQFLIMVAKGYITLENVGSSSIALQSIKRGLKETEIGGEVELPAKSIMSFAYRGAWCLRILGGNPVDLRVLKVETNNGGDFPNTLNMV